MFSLPPVEAGTTDLRTLYVQDMVCDARIGVYLSEKGRTQKIVVNLAVQLDYAGRTLADELANVLDYGVLHGAIRDLAGGRHLHLQETLAEEIADFCMARPEAGRVRAHRQARGLRRLPGGGLRAAAAQALSARR